MESLARLAAAHAAMHDAHQATSDDVAAKRATADELATATVAPDPAHVVPGDGAV